MHLSAKWPLRPHLWQVMCALMTPSVPATAAPATGATGTPVNVTRLTPGFLAPAAFFAAAALARRFADLDLPYLPTGLSASAAASGLVHLPLPQGVFFADASMSFL